MRKDRICPLCKVIYAMATREELKMHMELCPKKKRGA
jgi:Zn-finger nucleic acid-binding protein